MNAVERGRAGAERLAIARMVVGLVAFLFPRAFGRAWVGASGSNSQAVIVTRSFAVRDFALGLGAYRALKDGSQVWGWIEMGLLSDATDSAAALASRASTARRLIVAVGALVGVAGAVLALDGLEDSVGTADEAYAS